MYENYALVQVKYKENDTSFIIFDSYLKTDIYSFMHWWRAFESAYCGLNKNTNDLQPLDVLAMDFLYIVIFLQGIKFDNSKRVIMLKMNFCKGR